MEKLNNLLNRLYEASNNDTCMSLIYLIQQINNATNNVNLKVSDTYIATPVREYYNGQGERYHEFKVAATISFIYKGRSFSIIFDKEEGSTWSEPVSQMHQIKVIKIKVNNLWIENDNRRLEI